VWPVGVRLNTLNDPAFRMRLDAPEAGLAGGAVGANRVVPTLPEQENAGPRPPPAANRADEGNLLLEPPAQANAEAGPGGEATDAPAARLRDLRFLTPVESVRERDLETQLTRLEQSLESTDNRIRFTDSFSMRIDARLDRARLESDLDMIESEISRLRLERVFDGAAGPTVIQRARSGEQTAQAAGEVPSGSQPSASSEAPGLNLLA